MSKQVSTYDFYKDLPTWAKGVSVVILTGIAALVSWGIYKWLKNRPVTVDYPNNGQGIPAGWNATPIATRLHDVMSGLFTLSGTKDEAFKSYLEIPTDDMFVAVYNTFNTLYASENEGTLREWINDELYTDVTTTTRERLNERFNRLNLK